MTARATPCGGQGITFPADLRILPAGNVGMSQEILLKCPVVPANIVSKGEKVHFNFIYPILRVFRWHTI